MSKIFNVAELMIEAISVRNIKFGFQKLTASSSANNTPPIGAPKAADTPIIVKMNEFNVKKKSNQ